MSAATINPNEAAHFGALAADWWDPHGSSAMLHKLNPVRLAYIRDQIDRVGSIDGKALSDRLGDAPFGWSPDTLRYLVAAMLVAGEIKLKVAGREVTVNGQQAIDALKTNNSFKNVGISLRDDKPSMEMLALAAHRLTELSGDTVVPLEDAISKAATKLFPSLQQRYAPLAEKLKALGLPGADRLDSLSRDIEDILLSDASDAPQRLGKQESSLYESLVWARELKNALDQGLENTVRELQAIRQAVTSLPGTGIPAALKAELAEPLTQIAERLEQPDAYRSAADFNSRLTQLRTAVRASAEQMQQAQSLRLKDTEVDLKRVPEWGELTVQEQQHTLGEVEALALQVEPNMAGLKELINRDYEIQSRVQDLKREIERLGRERVQEKLRQEQKNLATEKGGLTSKVSRQCKAPGTISDIKQLEQLIEDLQRLRAELRYAGDFELTLKVEE